jgi:hypothetical protein
MAHDDIIPSDDFPEDISSILYQLWDEHQKLLGLFKTKEQAHKQAEKTKLQKYTVIGICMSS